MEVYLRLVYSYLPIHFRKTSQCGSSRFSISFLSILIIISEKLVSMEVWFCIDSLIYSCFLISEKLVSMEEKTFSRSLFISSVIFQKNQLVWKFQCSFHYISKIKILFQKNQLVWKLPINPYTSFILKVEFQKNQLVWKSYISTINKQQSFRSNFRKTSQYGSPTSPPLTNSSPLGVISEKLVSMEENQLSLLCNHLLLQFQKNQLVWKCPYSICWFCHISNFRKTSQYGSEVLQSSGSNTILL